MADIKYTSYRYPSNLADLIDNGSGGIQFSFYDRPNSQTSNLGGMVQLYLPNNLRNPMDINWDQTENDQVVGRMVEANGFWNSLEGLGTGLMAGSAKSLFDATNATEVTQQKKGVVANPFIAMTFKSLGFRKFSMEFKFTPHSGWESVLIDDIIKLFRRTALPEGGKGVSGGGFFGYPGEVKIEYIGNCKRWLPKFKPSVITALDVNYTGQGFYAGMKNGFPAETILTLEFAENQLVFRHDVTAGESY